MQKDLQMMTTIRPKRLFSAILIATTGLASCANLLQEPILDGKPVSFWIDALSGIDSDARQHASGILARSGETVVPHLVQAMKRDNSQLRLSIIDILRELGPDAKEALPSLAALLQDSNLSLRVNAAYAMVKIDCMNNERIKAALLAGLRGDSHLSGIASMAIQSFGPDGEWAVPYLLDMMSGKDPQAKSDAIGALLRMGQAAARALPELENLLGQFKKTDEGLVPSLEMTIATLKGELPRWGGASCYDRREK
jgi:hypothetical protein